MFCGKNNLNIRNQGLDTERYLGTQIPLKSTFKVTGPTNLKSTSRYVETDFLGKEFPMLHENWISLDSEVLGNVRKARQLKH